jgi:choline dehydrogenase
MESWSYAHCLPYFKKMETCLAGADEYRGGDGPLQLERGPATNPLFKAFFEAAQQAGYTLTSDVNGYRQEGFAPFDRNIRRCRRLSAARAYLHPVLERPNLELETRAQVTRVLFKGTRAVGRVPRRARPPARRARPEVILCGGSINTPQLLEPGRRRRWRLGVGMTWCTTCGSARTCRTTSRSTSNTQASSRFRSRPRCSTATARACS